MPGPSLNGVDARVGHQLDPGTDDAVVLPIKNDRPIHFCELTQRSRCVDHIQRETAGRDLRDDLVSAEHDECSGTPAQDPLTAVSEGRSGCQHCEVVEQPAVLIEVRRHNRSLRQPHNVEKRGRVLSRRCDQTHSLGRRYQLLHSPVAQCRLRVTPRRH
jgi:hypothetical protein